MIQLSVSARQSGLASGALLAALLALLLGPALANGTAFMFPDSLGYFHAGEAALKAAGRLFATGSPAAGGSEALVRNPGDGVSTARSVYYGVPLVLLYRLGGEWLVLVCQAGLVLAALGLGVRKLRLSKPAQWLLLPLLLLSGIGVYADAVMPDVFAGVVVLMLALLLGGAELAPGERRLLLVLLLLSCLFHKAILILSVAMLMVAALLAAARTVVGGRAAGTRRQLLAPLVVLGLAAAGHLAVDVAVTRVTGRPPVQTPFLLARGIGDGTVGLYLARHCPGAGFTLCGYLDRLPMTENVFLWSHDPEHGVMNALPPAETARIAREERALVLAAVRAYPLHQLRASLGNAMAQLGLVGMTEYALGPRAGPGTSPALDGLIARYEASLAGRGLWPFQALSVVMRVVYVGSLAVLLLALAWASAVTGQARQPLHGIIMWLLAGLVLNAVVNGVLAGVFDRYQGRLAWLAPLAMVAALAMLRGPAGLRGGR